MKTKNKISRRLGAASIIALGFLLLILLGALLLMLPIATEDGTSESPLICLFTATSASCVTGLVLVDTATNWSAFGESVILCLIQIGGLGFMTVAMMLSLLVKRTISPKERQIAAQSFNLSSYGGIVRLSKRIIFGTFVFEFFGAVALALRFIPMFGLKDGIWKSVFTSISAFCNAGFDLMGKETGPFSSLAGFYSDSVINITVMVLIVVGGIGFVVWDDLYRLVKEKKKLSVYTKIVLSATSLLLLFGAVSFALFEWNNEATIGNMNTQDKMIASFFQSVTTRTAGFNTVDLSSMASSTKLGFILLMFIGRCSGSTAGGVKVGTFAIVFVSVLRVLKGRSDVVLFRRKIAENNVLRAFAIIVLQFCVTVIGGMIIMSCGEGVLNSMFEAFSASGTVGVSLSLTTSMNLAGKITAMFLMYFGRVGILTVSYAIMSRLTESQKEFKNAEANVMVG